MRKARVCVFTAVVGVLGFSGFAWAAQYTEIRDLVHGVSAATDINNSGQVVGMSGQGSSSTRGFRYTFGPPEVLETLPPLPGDSASVGYGINSLGETVGLSETGGWDEHAVKWGVNVASQTSLGGNMSTAHSINDRGEIAGQVNASNSSAAYWGSGGMETLPSPAGPATARAINNASVNGRGQIVGFADSAVGGNQHRACLWQYSGTSWQVQVLPTLLNGSVFGDANDINDAGKIVGVSSAATGKRATLWDANGVHNLGDLPGGSDESWAMGINNHDQVVGYSYADGGQAAFLWDKDNGMQNLNDLPVVVGTGWTLLNAAAINDSGWIVGTGLIGGQERAYLLITPEPASLAFLALGGLMVLRRKQR